MIFILMLAVLGVARGWCADTNDTSTATSESSDPLLDLFIKKGYVTQEEAEKVKAEAEAGRTNGPANSLPAPSKWKIGDGIKNVGLFGDIRLRYEDRTAEDPKGGKIDLDRLRYALRVGSAG